MVHDVTIWDMQNMNWKKLYFGKVQRSEVKKYIPEEQWQSIRLSMKGVSLENKYTTLAWWLKHKDFCRAAQVQVTNYVTALSRGGLIKPEDYSN